MEDVMTVLRKAYVSQLSQYLTWNSQSIPVCEEYLNKDPARIMYDNREVQLYVIILNQVSNNTSPKCMQEDQSSLQIKITTVFPSGTGGSRLAEIIGNMARAFLFENGHATSTLVLSPPFNLWKAVIEGSRNINYETNNSREWNHIITINNWVTQS